jgi:hypothetical protein
VVIGSDGVYYRSLANGNQNNNPTTTSGFWTLLYSVEWNAGITYDIGAVVTYDNQQYQSLQTSNLNNNPASATSYWVPLNFAWVATATYSEDQNVVGTDGILYTSLQNSNTGNDPATSPAYWVGTSAAAAASAVAAAASAAAALVSENAAAADAVATAADVVQTGLDAAATAADAIATAADRVQTGLDAAATAADVILTNADAVATAADRVQTGLDAAATSADAIATAADRVQTGLDVIATNADASSTAADAIATAADVVQTGLDVVATSADVVQTGLDVTAAAGSASAASGSASAAAASAAAAASSYDAFDDRYLGDKASDPTLDNDGNALLTGALYFNTTSDVMKVYDGSAWNIAAISSASPTFTGTVTADGLVVNGDAVFSNGDSTVITGDDFSKLQLKSLDSSTSSTGVMSEIADVALVDFNGGSNNHKLVIRTNDGLAATGTLRDRIEIKADGDISFYEDTGTTPKFFWDASAESLLIGTGGTSSPAAPLVINDAASSGFKAKLTSSVFNADGNWLGLGMGYHNDYMKAAIIAEAKDANGRANLHFALDGSVGSGNVDLSDTKMTITYTGNVGIGVTPESWYTPLSTRALQIGSTTSLWALNNGPTDLRTTLDNNLYISAAGANTYLNTGPASRYQQANGQHVWSTVSSGTADTGATITERMRITSSGNVGIGIANPAVQVQLGDGTATTQWIRAFGSVSDIYVGQNTSITHFGLTNASKILSTTGNPFALGTTASQPIVFGTNNTERLRIDSSGNVGIGNTIPSSFTGLAANNLVVGSGSVNEGITIYSGNATNNYGAIAFADGVSGSEQYRGYILYQHDVDALRIATSAGERMRIDSSGNLLLNTANSPTTTKAIISSDYSASGTTNTGITIAGRQAGNWWNNGIHALGSSGLVFSTGTTGIFGADATNERMRIDSSGNLLVGSTILDQANNSNTANCGINLLESGIVSGSTNGTAVAYFNRLTSDGGIVSFRKDGTTVGIIGTKIDDLTIGTGGTGIRFDVGLSSIIPYSVSPEGNTNGSTSLGVSTARFKDAHFSGTVNAANISETVYALSGTALDPANGGIQTKTLAANTTFTDSLASGESLVLQLEAGASYTVTWPTMKWVTSSGNVAPTLTAKDTLVFWKVSSTLYGAYTGSYV